MMRAISHSEAATALDCFAKHAFGYTGALTGGRALVGKHTPPQLRDGRAWGIAVAAFHQHRAAHTELTRALQEDADQQREFGSYDEGEFAATVSRLTRTLDHYTTLTERLDLLEVEHELLVPIPSRGGHRHSTRYRLHCFLDGIHRDAEGRVWIVEFKLRGRLSSDQQIALARQTRWYAWAWRQATGTAPAGVIVDERLNAAPAGVRLNKDGTPSKVQSSTPQAYLWACERAERVADPEVLAGLYAKEWQKRTPVLFRPSELEEAGWQLVSAANLIRQLDNGSLYPIRNPSPARCPGCQFKEICDTPEDAVLVESLFRLVTPKAQRGNIEIEREAA